MTENKPQPSTPFGQWIVKVLDDHGESLRGQRRRTGLAHSTLMNWLDGVKPGMEAVIAFARGFGEDINEALTLAGYEPILPAMPAEPAEPTYDQVFGERYRAMTARLEADGIKVPGRGSAHGGSEGLAPEDAVAEIEELERVLRKLAGKG